MVGASHRRRVMASRKCTSWLAGAVLCVGSTSPARGSAYSLSATAGVSEGPVPVDYHEDHGSGTKLQQGSRSVRSITSYSYSDEFSSFSADGEAKASMNLVSHPVGFGTVNTLAFHLSSTANSGGDHVIG